MTKSYTFQEITEPFELEKFFRLRYEVYSGSRMKSFLKENPHRVDWDVYDLHAIHYGLFCEEEPVGYLRLVLHKQERYNGYAAVVGRKYGWYEEAIPKADYPDFPFLNYPFVPATMKAYYARTTTKGVGFVEASRLVVLPDFRQTLTTKHLVECAITAWTTLFPSAKEGVINCIKRHAAFYASYGFSAIAESEGAYVAGGTLIRLMLTFGKIPLHFTEVFEAMKAEFTQTGKIVRHL